MAQSHPKSVALFVHPDAERRGLFQRACAELFERLLSCSGAAEAGAELARRHVDLLIIDVWQLQRPRELAALGELVRSRSCAATLLLCPFSDAGWIPGLMAFGPLHYLITPSSSAELQQCVRQALPHPRQAPDAEQIQFQLQLKERELRELLVMQRSVQRVLADNEDADKLAQKICLALCAFPDVRHSALFQFKPRGGLHLLAQERRNHLDLRRLLGGDADLQDGPLREAFPGLLAARSGALVLLDAPEKAGHPEMAVRLDDKGVQMVLGVPLARDPGAAVQGALCLMFEQRAAFSREQFSAFAGLAQLISFGLAMGELKERNDALRGQLERASGVDELTGASKWRHGEFTLAREVGRARRYATPLALVAFEIDSCGVDLDLKAAAAATQAALRGADTLVRQSENGFLIIAPHTSQDNAVKVAEKIRVAIGEMPASVGLSMHFGVAGLGAGEEAQALLARLAAALQGARCEGGGIGLAAP